MKVNEVSKYFVEEVAPMEVDGPSLMQIEIYRRMTPQERLRVAAGLYWSARSLKAAGLRLQHPEWSDEQITCAVRDLVLRVGD